MNIELAFIKSVEYGKVVELVNERLNGSLRDIRFCSQMDVPDSYDAILANDVKRKVAISSSRNGWIAIIESKEVNDYAMLLQLSKEIQTEVLAILQSDVAGAWGYVEMFEGKVIKTYFSEEDDEIEDLIDEKMNEKRIDIPIYMFREVIREKGKGWDIVQINN